MAVLEPGDDRQINNGDASVPSTGGVNQPPGLSLEQQFSLRSFETQVQQMSREQAQDFLIKLYEQMMVRENLYKQFLKHSWGFS